jgi:hypothetical protein
MPWNDLSDRVDSYVIQTGCSLDDAVDLVAEEFDLAKHECMSRYLQERQPDHGDEN